MKATLEFNLPDDEDEFHNATQAKDYYCSLWDIKSYIRNKLKHGWDGRTTEQILEDINELIPELR